jgi:DNA-binding NarL/FixJ family response regulator
MPRTVFIVDDHPIFCEGLVNVINEESDLVVRGCAGTAAKALEGIALINPDLVVLDISLPDKSGLEVIKEVRSRGQKVKLLVVSMHDEALYANRVLETGADGYIMKMEDPAEIVQAMRDVLDGHIYVSDQVLAGQPNGGRERCSIQSGKLTRPLEALSDRDLEILERLGQNETEKEIAAQLGLGARALDLAVAKISRKLNLKSHRALLRYAVCWVETEAR